MRSTLLRRTSYAVIGAILLFLLVIFPAASNRVYAQDSAKDAACKGIGAALGTSSTDCSDDGSAPIQSTVKTAINVLSFVVGIISVFMIIVAGLKFITSSGDSSSVSSAKNTVIYALVGLVIVAVAQTIVRLTLSKVAPTPTPTP